MGKESRKKCFTNQFDTDLCEDVTKISAITMRFGKCVATDSGDGKYKTWQPGQPVYGNITFEGVCHPSTFTKIQTWVKDCYDGKEIRKTLTINLRTHQQTDPARTFNLVDSFPQAFNYVDIAAEGNAGSVIHWTLEVRVDRIEMV
jgi:phage tail-like protein